MFNVPAICERESQNKSVPFEPITVNGLFVSAVAVERLTTTSPPRALPVILEPLNSACELLLTTTPWLPETIRLEPAVSVDPFVTKINIYQRGLEAIRKQKSVSSDQLEPSWGEPELLMNLAWSNLHRKTPDLSAARTYAQSALTLVPYWHYVRDILMPQIQKAIDATKIQGHFERNAVRFCVDSPA